jgi:hypothetical protein
MPRSATPFAAHFPRVCGLLAPHRARSALAPPRRCTSRCISLNERAPLLRPASKTLPARAKKDCAKPVRRNQYRFSSDFLQLVLFLDHFCPIAQLFPPPLRATLQRKLKYESTHTTATRSPGPPPQTQTPQTQEKDHRQDCPCHASRIIPRQPRITRRESPPPTHHQPLNPCPHASPTPISPPFPPARPAPREHYACF